jgi:cobyrinic acid a,c-diamide synthase
MTLGYRTMSCSRHCILGETGMTAKGHEYHYSTLVGRGPLDYACALRDAQGDSKGSDGLVMGNTLALYTHIHFASQPQLAGALIASARRTRMEPSLSSRALK